MSSSAPSGPHERSSRRNTTSLVGIDRRLSQAQSPWVTWIVRYVAMLSASSPGSRDSTIVSPFDPGGEERRNSAPLATDCKIYIIARFSIPETGRAKIPFVDFLRESP